MKKHLLSLCSLALVLSVTSCTIDIREDNDASTSTKIENTTGSVMEGSGSLNGTITKDLLIKKGNYTLDGVVKVASGVTLTIEPGAVFTANSSNDTSLVILQGAKINAQGTADNPIVFTSNTKIPGDWGGISIYGKAPIIALNGAKTAISEDGNNLQYGGDDANDNSGVMKFVRVEYGGKKIGDGKSENNSMTFYSVGAGTVLENLVAYKGTDDGFEFFGGTVSATNLVSYGNFDDSFDWQDGWSGQNNSNWFAYQTKVGNFGMEIEASSNKNNTAPKINGITLIREAGTKPEVEGSTEISAIQFKKQGSGIFKNVYIDGYKDTDGKKAYAVLIQDKDTQNDQVATNNIKVTPINYLNSSNPAVWGYGYANDNPASFTSDSSVKKVNLVSGAWANVDGVDLLKALK
ncbi:hypothetical protein D1Z97_03005 [Riemerella anatipestifer]|uniref:Lipoprotein n=1 Tax=Riemerella anatipestifer (strain ATCC 11845 / DSM 15868 / JCM 9532 / NCTC 11014) TaxID=693978 RepID=E4TDE6_RIEAD|nr:hypothetical protein [Riemerella anatipestifer]ADQ82805.1 hypothetical protein Riean_1649 [Riemerella anatipestifer ATCC 11845 = DSM 15868]AFD56815.1 hypothetical protein RA0C_1944 [Riemerella anatipestifer ATCC 11845 = DSM 15868]MRM92357.1 hypothetical protein [Riemerella anatipestifer]MRM96526.1 hypothetical protein [Riemerella anatipestifer]MRN00176.1 hypothetical protein [Riemerella anatipestifer]